MLKHASYILRCDDADPESQCTYSAEGTSVDEVYQTFMRHANSRHSDTIKAMSPERMKAFEARLQELLQAPKP